MDRLDTMNHPELLGRGISRFAPSCVPGVRLRHNLEDSPEFLFSKLITARMMEQFVTATNSYAVNTNRSRWIELTVSEFKLYLGLAMFMGAVPLPSQHLYAGRSEVRQVGIKSSNYPVWKLTEPEMYHHQRYILCTDNLS